MLACDAANDLKVASRSEELPHGTLRLGRPQPAARVRQDVERQPLDGVGRVVDRSARLSLTWPAVELVGDVAGVGEGAGEAVELGDEEGVSVVTGCERFA